VLYHSTTVHTHRGKKKKKREREKKEKKKKNQASRILKCFLGVVKSDCAIYLVGRRIHVCVQ
jgi:hypothetical protein